MKLRGPLTIATTQNIPEVNDGRRSTEWLVTDTVPPRTSSQTRSRPAGHEVWPKEPHGFHKCISEGRQLKTLKSEAGTER